MNKGDYVFNKFFGTGIIIEINSKSACIKFNAINTTRHLKIGFFKKVK